MSKTIPLPSHEVRWFLEESVNQQGSLKTCFETIAPFEKASGVGLPEWKDRLNGEPDLYLLVPGGDNIGIKWREKELQVKGRVSAIGTVVFSGVHQGNVERWIKWSYPGLPISYRTRLFSAQDETVIGVQKTRALRKIRLDTLSGAAQEVNPKTFIDRGVNIELADLSIRNRRYCSLAFEAFPNDSGIDAAFTDTVEIFLKELTEVRLTARMSSSYPSFLLKCATAGSQIEQH